MSRLWADRLCVSLTPDSVALARVRGRWRPKLVAKHRMESEQPLDALRTAVAALGKARLDASVVLSNRFVRYAIVPYDPAVSGTQEEAALARFHFNRIHGERAKNWDLRVGSGPPGGSRLACAVDSSLIPAIRAAFPSDSGIRLVSVQPYLMAAYNRWRNPMAKEDAWLVLPETDSVCLAYATRSGWLAASSMKGVGAEDTSVAEGLQRERLRLAAAPRAALVHGEAPPAPAGWKVSRAELPRLEGYSPHNDGAWDMALCAL